MNKMIVLSLSLLLGCNALQAMDQDHYGDFELALINFINDSANPEQFVGLIEAYRKIPEGQQAQANEILVNCPAVGMTMEAFIDSWLTAHADLSKPIQDQIDQDEELARRLQAEMNGEQPAAPSQSSNDVPVKPHVQLPELDALARVEIKAIFPHTQFVKVDDATEVEQASAYDEIVKALEEAIDYKLIQNLPAEHERVRLTLIKAIIDKLRQYELNPDYVSDKSKLSLPTRVINSDFCVEAELAQHINTYVDAVVHAGLIDKMWSSGQLSMYQNALNRLKRTEIKSTSHRQINAFMQFVELIGMCLFTQGTPEVKTMFIDIQLKNITKSNLPDFAKSDLIQAIHVAKKQINK